MQLEKTVFSKIYNKNQVYTLFRKSKWSTRSNCLQMLNLNFQNPDQAHIPEEIYWEHYRKSIALASCQPPVDITQDRLDEKDIKTSPSPLPPHLSIKEEPVKEFSDMEVDEIPENLSSDQKVQEPEKCEEIPTATKIVTMTMTMNPEEATGQEDKSKGRVAHNSLIDEGNFESRGSTSSNEDMWRPW